MENDYVENGAAKTAVTLSVLREEALDHLLKDGKASSFKSEGTQTDRGLRVNTVDETDGSRSSLLIKGDEEMGTGWTGVYLNGNYDIERQEDGRTTHEKGKFNLFNSHFDDFRGLSHFRVSMERTDASGNKIEAYIPAQTTIKSEGGKIAYDPNGQPVRLAETISGANCKPDYSHRGSRKMDCEYILQDAELGTLSFNETREKLPAGFYHRSVVRDMKGNVLGILNQNYRLDEHGNLIDATTSARKPQGKN